MLFVLHFLTFQTPIIYIIEDLHIWTKI